MASRRLAKDWGRPRDKFGFDTIGDVLGGGCVGDLSCLLLVFSSVVLESMLLASTVSG